VLPALTIAWSQGAIKDVVARGGFEIDIQWYEGKLTKLKITSLLGNDVKLRYRDVYKEYKMEKGSVLQFNNELEKF